MSKYNYKEIKKRSEDAPLPADINESVESIARKFNDDELMKSFDELRVKRYYGTLYHYENDSVAAYFEFSSGICIRSRLVKKFGKKNEFHMNVINKKVSLKTKDIE